MEEHFGLGKERKSRVVCQYKKWEYLFWLLLRFKISVIPDFINKILSPFSQEEKPQLL